MRKRMSRVVCLLVSLAICLVPLAAPTSALAQSQKVPWQKVTPSKLTVVWWQWFLGQPVSDNPAFDETGAKALNGQPYPDLVFLCGTFALTPNPGGGVIGQANRSITIKQGTALFFPLINFEQDNVGLRPGRLGAGIGTPGGNLSVPQMQAMTSEFATSTTNLSATLTQGSSTASLPHSRLQSPVFSFKMPATDNIYQSFGLNVSGAIAPAVADGHWTLIPPGTLQPGAYALRFGGQVPGFTQDIQYRITVTP